MLLDELRGQAPGEACQEFEGAAGFRKPGPRIHRQELFERFGREPETARIQSLRFWQVADRRVAVAGLPFHPLQNSNLALFFPFLNAQGAPPVSL